MQNRDYSRENFTILAFYLQTDTDEGSLWVPFSESFLWSRVIKITSSQSWQSKQDQCTTNIHAVIGTTFGVTYHKMYSRCTSSTQKNAVQRPNHI